jgi:hypothetical protein
MKKILLIGLIVALLLIVVGGAGIAYAAIRGFDRNTTALTTILQNDNEVIKQFRTGPGGMMGQGTANCVTDDTGKTTCTYGPGGMMGGQGFGPGVGGQGFGPGMMGGGRFDPDGIRGKRGMFAQGSGVMRDYMVSAFADAVGLTVDEVNTRLANGETLAQIALDQGKAEADLPALLTQVRQAALDKAVADGVITQAQADLMKQHMGNYPGGYGEGCPMFDEQQLP